MGEYFWINSPKGYSDIPIGAHVLGRFNGRIKVRDDDSNEYWIQEENMLCPMHQSSVQGVHDMVNLKDLQEYSILRNLQIRYAKDFIYTYTGSILVAINPYKKLPIYDNATMSEYRKKRPGELPPHIFAVADYSYESMRKKLEKRCIVISGESGSGKTESTKFLLQYFARISHKRSKIEQQILGSNPVLEAFGNAKTACNDNSSRFGKYITIHFSVDGSISSAQIKHYLLEKSRIVYQNKEEQNYHIFYAILSGMTEKEKRLLNLKDISQYNYLNKGQYSSIHDLNKTGFGLSQLKESMRVLDFTDTEIWNIFELIAAILHLGNIQYKTSTISNMETVEVEQTKEITKICSLLGITQEPLIASLIHKSISTHGDNVVQYLSKQQAIDSRDAFVKRIYGNIFNFIVNKINEILSKDEMIKSSNLYIGILDIFGFEVYDKNSFEQLCINYANEKLQQFFVRDIFKAEQHQYNIENINWSFIRFTDNQDVLDLIEVGPTSILSVINDESKLPKGSDRTMLDKLIDFHSDNYNFFKPKYKNTMVFGIKHYAGVVLYDVKDFIEKNHDTCSFDFKQLVRSSKNTFLKQIFVEDFESDSNPNYKKRTETLFSKFKNSLDLLMHELYQCNPFFVRCIKPNEMKKPQKFDRMLCCKQLRYSGMTETAKIREAGYGIRYDYVQFVERYRILCPGIPLAFQTDCKEATAEICKVVFGRYKNSDFQLGNSKVFLKHKEEELLERERDKALYPYVVIIQKTVRGWLCRRRYQKMRKAVTILKKSWIEKQRNKTTVNILKGFHRLQAKLKSRLLTYEFQRNRHLFTLFQAHCKGYLTRKLYNRKLQQLKSKNPEDVQQIDNSSMIFKKFADDHFQEKNNHEFSKKPLKTSLLHHFQPDDVIIAKAMWLTILRYTGIIAEPKKNESYLPIKLQLKNILERINNKKVIEITIRRAVKLNYENTKSLYDNWLKSRLSDIEKLHFIIGHGIAMPELRDEIYCQICKTLTKNPMPTSVDQSWNLLSVCTGCFPPSDLLLKCLKSFIQGGPKKYISYCLSRLHRINQNGPRTQPPYHTELAAINQQKPVELKVYITNGTTTCADVDGCITARELLRTVAENINLTDSFGFGLVLVHNENELSLGDGSNFVLDAVSEIEQDEIKSGENASPWQLILKKEIFAPWHDCTTDEVSNLLTCRQIIHGIRNGDYVCDSKESASLIAQICYVERWKWLSKSLYEAIDFYMPYKTQKSSESKIKDFKAEVEKEYDRMFGKSQKPMNAVRGDILNYAETYWNEQFAKKFHVMGTMENTNSFSNQQEKPFLVSVNSSGVRVNEDSDEGKLLTQFEFMKIKDITNKQTVKAQGYTIKIVTQDGLEMTFRSQKSNDNGLHELLVRILETLKKYSKYVRATKDCTTYDTGFLELKKGDLVTLTLKFKGKDLMLNSWAEGQNNRTRKTGKILLDNVEIIPTIKPPPRSTIIALDDADTSLTDQSDYQVDRLKQYTLESYASRFFRKISTDSVEGNSSALWTYSKNKSNIPLHANLLNDQKVSSEAKEAFEAILVYLNRQPKAPVNEEQTVQKVFTLGLQNDKLRDELYCQIMKQLTSNSDKETEARAWELMWMITGLFSCGEILANEVKKFLQSRRTSSMARECLTRFQKISRSEPRKLPPHPIEIEAVRYKPCRILYKVFFPDDTHKFFQIDSLSKPADFNTAILNRLTLSSCTGFTLVVQVNGRIFSIPEEYYIFDYFQILRKWMKKEKTATDQYIIRFMKINWKNITPGQDKIIDLKFVYPQEYDVYLLGHHKIPSKDIPYLGALLRRVYEATYKSKPNTQNLKKLIPSTIYKEKQPDSLMKEIESKYSTVSSMSEEDAKMAFLKYIHNLPTYGSTYFTVKPEDSDLSNYMFYPINLT